LKADNSPELESVLLPIGQWVSQPFQEDYFDFGQHQDYTKSGHELIHQLSDMPGLETVNEDFIYFDRTLYGMLKIFERLEAKVYMRTRWEKLWGTNG